MKGCSVYEITTSGPGCGWSFIIPVELGNKENKSQTKTKVNKKFIKHQKVLPSSPQAPAQAGLSWLYSQLIQPPTRESFFCQL